MADSRQEPECPKRQRSPISRLRGRGGGNFSVHTRRVGGGEISRPPGERPVAARRAAGSGRRRRPRRGLPATDEEPHRTRRLGPAARAGRAPAPGVALAPHTALATAASGISSQQRAAAVCGCQRAVLSSPACVWRGLHWIDCMSSWLSGWLGAWIGIAAVFRSQNLPQNPNFPSHQNHIETLNIANDPCMEY